MATCPGCGGSGTESVYVNGTIQDWKVCSWCAGSGTTSGTSTNSSSTFPSSARSTSSSKDSIEHFSELIGLLIWGAVAYVGIAKLGHEWPWPVGTGLVAGIVVSKLLSGPFRHVTEILYKITVTAFVIALAVFLINLFSNSGG